VCVQPDDRVTVNEEGPAQRWYCPVTWAPRSDATWAGD
jgi:hypothetical protein